MLRKSLWCLSVPMLVSCESATQPLGRSDQPRIFADINSGITRILPASPFTLQYEAPLDTFPSLTIIELTIGGKVESYYHDGQVGQGPLWRTIDYRGTKVGSSCHGPVKATWGSYQYGANGDCQESSDGTAMYHGLVRAIGAGRVTRSSLYSDGTSCLGGPCRYHEGEHWVSYKRVSAELVLTPSQVLIPPGQSVTFTASVSPSSIGAFPTPFGSRSWSWQPDGGLATKVCSTGATCSRSGSVNGTLTVTATVNGVVKTNVARVEAKIDQLLLVANKSNVKPGEEVRFTASMQNGTDFTVQGWAWVSTGGGPMQLTPTGQSCGQEEDCTIRVYEDGYMTVTGVVEGTTIPQSASASVDVIPCPPAGAGSASPLEVDAVRNRLLEELALSRAGARSERGGDIWFNPTTGAYYVRVIPNAYVSSCSYKADAANAPPVPPGFTEKVPAIWHTHPDKPGGTLVNCWEEDDSGNMVKVAGNAGHGPSWRDWVAAYTGGVNGLEGIVIDANLDMWQYNVPIDRYYDALESREAYKYRKDGDSICYGNKSQPLKTP